MTLTQISKSTTVQFNALVPAISAIVGFLWKPIPEEIIIAVLVIGNFVLRLITKEPISAK